MRECHNAVQVYEMKQIDVILLWAAGAMLIIAGCTSTAHEPASYAPQSGTDTDAQTRARLHTELAAGYLELGNYGVALQEATEALKSDPNFAPAFNVLGLVYMELRDDKAAESSFSARCG